MKGLYHRCYRIHRVFTVAVFLLFCSGIGAAASPANSPAALLPSNTFDINRYNGKNLILFIYALDDPRVDQAVQLMKELYTIRREYNFEIAGICINADRLEDVQNYNQNKSIPFPVYLDHNKLVYSRLKMTGGIGFYLFNKQGKLITSKLGSFTPSDVNLVENWRVHASAYLKIGYIPADEPFLGLTPPVPLFNAKTLSGDRVDMKELYEKKPTVLVIFSPKCSHCQDELSFLNTLYTDGDLKGRFEIVAVSILDEQITADFIGRQRFAFPVISDSARKIVALFPSFTGSIPISYLINRSGSIVSLHKGFDDYLRDIYVMELKKLAGLPNPPLLSKNGYSGAKSCEVCHEKEQVQWKLTRHADAFQSLVRKGEEDNPQCVVCHVVGFGSPGGYDMTNKKLGKYFVGVQCESCHGPGYLSCAAFTKRKPKKKKTAEWKERCLSCHTKTESINFIFSKRYPRILHTNAPDLSKMSREERLRVVQAYRQKQDLFDNPAKYMGATSCKECHVKQYAHWEKTVHATIHNMEKASAAPAEKQFRFNTGVGSPGGYPEAGREGVQCEACHGPGEKHLEKPEAKGQSYILGLGSECESCVVEQICRRCHSAADDPEFDFKKAIEHVRHK